MARAQFGVLPRMVALVRRLKVLFSVEAGQSRCQSPSKRGSEEVGASKAFFKGSEKRLQHLGRRARGGAGEAAGVPCQHVGPFRL